MQLPVKATSLTFKYSEPEDRLIVLASEPAGTKIGLFLTRRMIGRLINGLAGILEKSSLAASHAPAEMRDDVVLLEHQGAIGNKGAPPQQGQPATGMTPARNPAQAAREPVQVQSVHIQSIDISVKPRHFELVLKDGKRQPIVTMDIGRPALHRLLDMLTRKAEEADWNIRIAAKWLEPGQTSVSLN